MSDTPDDSQLGLFGGEPASAELNLFDSEEEATASSDAEPPDVEPASPEPVLVNAAHADPPTSEQSEAPPPEREPPPPPPPPSVTAAQRAPAPQPPADVAPDDSPFDALAGIVGQPDAVEVLRTALDAPLPGYLFLGPSAAGLRDAACRFAGELLALHSQRPNAERQLATNNSHADVVVFDRIGPALTADQAREAVRLAQLAPSVGAHKVLVICDAHLATNTAPILLKAVEEPTASTTFIITAESVTPALVTLASRCVQVQFAPLDVRTIADALTAEGHTPEVASSAAHAADGSLERARLLAADPTATERIELWANVLGRLDRNGASAMVAADEVLEAITAAGEPLRSRQAAELEADAEAVEVFGIDRRKNAELDSRHAREQRRHKAEEIAMGLGILADAVRTAAPQRGTGWAFDRLNAIDDAREAINRNANPRLALAWLFLRAAG